MQTRLDIRYPALLKVALPMSFGALVQFVVAFTDNYFVARLDGNAMSAVSFVGLVYITLGMVAYGLGNGAQILVARRKGENKLSEAGTTAANAFWIGVATSIVQFALLLYVTPPLLERYIDAPELRSYMNEFLRYRAFGFFFYTLTILLHSFWSGIATTRIMMYSTVITALVNIVLDWSLIFGHLGMPAMGVGGAALATVIAEAAGLTFVVIYTIRHRESRECGLWTSILKVPLHQTAALFRLGGPIILQLLISLGVWVVFYNFVEKLGTASFQSSFIVRNMYMLGWVSVMGFSTTTKTYVSGLIAEGRQGELRSAIRRLMLLNLAGVALLTHGLILYPEAITGMFTEDAATAALTVRSMLVVFPAILTFSITSILLATVEGSGNTVAGFVIELLTTAVYIIVAWWLSIGWQLPVYIVWMSDYVYFILLGLLSLAFLWNGKWKYTRV